MKKHGFEAGDALCTTQDGVGKKHLTYAFAGSINETPKEYSDTVEWCPKPDWSNGSDTKAIETKLRATKKKFSYIEVESHRHGGKRTGAGRKK